MYVLSVFVSLAADDDYAIDIFSFGICALEVREELILCIVYLFSSFCFACIYILLICACDIMCVFIKNISHDIIF